MDIVLPPYPASFNHFMPRTTLHNPVPGPRKLVGKRIVSAGEEMEGVQPPEVLNTMYRYLMSCFKILCSYYMIKIFSYLGFRKSLPKNTHT